MVKKTVNAMDEKNMKIKREVHYDLNVLKAERGLRTLSETIDMLMKFYRKHCKDGGV